MSQFMFSVKRTPRGQLYCVAYTAMSKDAIAVSRQAYDNAEQALNDVLGQLERSPEPQPVRSGNYQGIPSAAAGGVR